MRRSLGRALSKCVATRRYGSKSNARAGYSLSLPGSPFSSLNSRVIEARAIASRGLRSSTLHGLAPESERANERARACPSSLPLRVSYFNRSLPPTAKFCVSRSRRKNYSMAYRLAAVSIDRSVHEHKREHK